MSPSLGVPALLRRFAPFFKAYECNHLARVDVAWAPPPNPTGARDEECEAADGQLQRITAPAATLRVRSGTQHTVPAATATDALDFAAACTGEADTVLAEGQGWTVGVLPLVMLPAATPDGPPRVGVVVLAQQVVPPALSKDAYERTLRRERIARRRAKAQARAAKQRARGLDGGDAAASATAGGSTIIASPIDPRGIASPEVVHAAAAPPTDPADITTFGEAQADSTLPKAKPAPATAAAPVEPRRRRLYNSDADTSGDFTSGTGASSVSVLSADSIDSDIDFATSGVDDAGGDDDGDRDGAPLEQRRKCTRAEAAPSHKTVQRFCLPSAVVRMRDADPARYDRAIARDVLRNLCGAQLAWGSDVEVEPGLLLEQHGSTDDAAASRLRYLTVTSLAPVEWALPEHIHLTGRDGQEVTLTPHFLPLDGLCSESLPRVALRSGTAHPARHHQALLAWGLLTEAHVRMAAIRLAVAAQRHAMLHVGAGGADPDTQKLTAMGAAVPPWLRETVFDLSGSDAAVFPSRNELLDLEDALLRPAWRWLIRALVTRRRVVGDSGPNDGGYGSTRTTVARMFCVALGLTIEEAEALAAETPKDWLR